MPQHDEQPSTRDGGKREQDPTGSIPPITVTFRRGIGGVDHEVTARAFRHSNRKLLPACVTATVEPSAPRLTIDAHLDQITLRGLTARR